MSTIMLKSNFVNKDDTSRRNQNFEMKNRNSRKRQNLKEKSRNFDKRVKMLRKRAKMVEIYKKEIISKKCEISIRSQGKEKRKKFENKRNKDAVKFRGKNTKYQ